MSEWLVSVGPAVANHLWQSTGFAVVAWGVTLLLRKNQARLRYGVWLVASVKFLIPLSLLIGLGGMLPRPQRPVVTMPVYSTVDAVGMPFNVDSAPAVAHAVHVHVSLTERWLGYLPEALAAVWLCGVAVVLMVWAGRWRAVTKSLRRAQYAEDGRETNILRRLEAELGWRRPVRLLLSSELMEPGMFGLWRPKLIWPQQLSEKLSDEHIEAIVAHELMHARRRDNLTAALHMLVEAAFWFHPMVWWMERRMVEEREHACDEAVVTMGNRPGVYAESLLKACRFCVESPLVCVSGITGADLAKRVRSIMSLRVEGLGFAMKAGLAVLGLAVVMGPVGFGVVRMIPLYGQVFKATGPLPSYEFVVIKPSQEEAHGAGTEGDTTHYGVTAKMLIQFAYSVYTPTHGVIDLKVVGGPDWINTDVFSIVGKVDAATYEQNKGLSRQKSHEQRQLMEQSLLADRFKLKMHTEMQDQPVYALTVAKAGKLTPAKDATGSFRFNPFPSNAAPESITRGLVVNRVGGHLQLTAKGMSIEDLVNALAAQKETNGEHIVDQTGLTGAYDFTLTWGPPDNAGAVESDAAGEPPLFTALQQQLGVKLTTAKAPAEVVVIDHIQKPVFDEAENVRTSARMTRTAIAEVQPARLESVALVRRAPPASVPSAPLPVYDVVSIRENKSGSGAMSIGMRGGDGYAATNVNLKTLVTNAYDFSPPYLITGLPRWAEEVRFDLVAKVSNPDVVALKRLTGEQRSAMLLAILADRFHVQAHFVSKTLPIYDLVITKGGPKLTENAAFADPDKVNQLPRDRRPGSMRVSQGHIIAFGIPASNLAANLSYQVGRHVTDQTGLGGKYDIELSWTPDNTPADSPSAGGPSIFTAIQEQLGLRLEPSEGPVDTLVVDHVERPSEN